MYYRIYICRPNTIALGNTLPLDPTDITFTERHGSDEGDVNAMIEYDYGDRYIILGTRDISLGIPHDIADAYTWLQSLHNVYAAPAKRKPVVCPEVWFEGKTDIELAMKAVRDLCKGIR